ncbi:MFS transporter [Lasiosphaeria hispida]|uniref:MFS transporter n=1 Tax=Lasiosphaeria hispida TaxID=260671 RepID=A0AAJ0MF97_9PEZI|nr:MFS transporter [Lasiosphaeria hispida]
MAVISPEDDKAARAVDKLDHDVQSGISNGLHDNGDEEADRKAFLATFTADEDKAIRRKVDRKFLWLIGLIYIIKNIDYQNAASVRVLQVGQPTNIIVQLKMTADEYNWVQSIYFISYIVFEVPSNLLLKRMSPRNWQTRILLSWGIVLACHTAVKNKEGLYAARFFLGLAEAGMFPGIAAQLCSWYRSDEMGKPIMWMFGFQNCSGIIGSLLAYGISYLDGVGGLSAWQWVYLLEGIFTILFAAVVYLVLPDYPKSPRSASWLTPREQEYLDRRLSENAPRTGDSSFDKSEMLMNLGGYALTWQLPTVTTNLGFAGLPRNQLLNIPPAAASVLAIIFAGWFMKRAYLTRPAFIMWICGGALVFFVILATSSNRYAIYIACVFGMMFYSVYFIPFWAWRSSTLSGTTGTAFTLAFQSCVGQVPFAISATAVGLGWLGSCVTWYLTRNVEYDVKRIRRLRIKTEKAGKVYTEQDIKVFEERNFYNKGLGKKSDIKNVV